MRARSTGTLIVSAAVFLLAGWQSCFADEVVSVEAVRELGIQIKQAADNAEAGKQPAQNLMVQFERELNRIRLAVSSAHPDRKLDAKIEAIGLVFAKLKAPHSTAAPSSIRGSRRPNIDVEVVAAHHGDACASGLGLSESLPVTVTLAQHGKGKDEAWFRFEPGATTHYRFRTESSGADPAIEVFQTDCRPNAAAIASNDDTFGLDAAVSVAGNAHQVLIAHVTNAGQAGPIVLSVEATTGTISGRITDAVANTPISYASVVFFNSSNNFVASTSSDQNGDYSVSLAPDSYYVRAATNSYVPELYPSAPCKPWGYYYGIGSCAIAQAQAIPLTSDATVSGINIALSKGMRLAGQVRDASNQPIAATLQLLDDSQNIIGSLGTDNFGRYAFTTLIAGTYAVVANANGYASQMYDHVACAGLFQNQCDLTKASAVQIANLDIFGIDFNLPAMGAIYGTITGPGGQPITGYSSVLTVLDSNFNPVSSYGSYFDAAGQYVSGPLPPGGYYAFVGSNGYFSQIFNGIDCGQNCSQSTANATLVSISQSGQRARADFQLTPLPTLHGHVQDAATGLPLANVIVAASANPPASFNALTSATTDSNGDYTLVNTPAGTYYVWARSADHIDQVYPNIACESFATFYYNPTATCDVIGATLLNIAPGQLLPTFDFSLNAASTIRGRATVRAGNGSDLPAGVQINVYNGAGIAVASANTDASGNYTINDLPPATYFVVGGDPGYYYSQYMPQLWRQIDCSSNCVPTTGTPVILTQNTTTVGIDFSLVRRDAVVGRITSSIGDPIGGAVIDLFDAATNVYKASGISDAQGFYAVGATTGYSYFVATDAGAGYVDQIYSGVSCPAGAAYFGLCAFSNATSVGLGSAGTQPHIVNFTLQGGNAIFHNGFE